METAAYAEMRALEDRHWWFRGRRRLVRDLLSSALDEARAQARDAGHRPRLLEIGCGTGGNLASLERDYAAGGARDLRLGLDRDTGAVAFCAERGLDAELLQGDGLRLPLADDSVDLVLALDVIEHFEDDAGLLAEFRRVLRPGGELVASVPLYPSLWSPHDEFLHHVRRYASGELEQKLSAAGLPVQRRHGFNFLLLPAIALVRRVKARLQGDAPPAGTDFFELPGPLNGLFSLLFATEALLVRIAPVPFGVSLMLRARKR